MQNSPLLVKSKTFAVKIVKLCNDTKQNFKDTVITNQLLRSGTSIGANIRESFYAHGKADFISKLQISLKECSETEYWLELLIDCYAIKCENILNDCIEIKKLLITSINTTKKHLQ